MHNLARMLRAAEGFTGRANSCHAVGDPGLPIGEAAARSSSHSAESVIRLAELLPANVRAAATVEGELTGPAGPQTGTHPLWLSVADFG